MLRVTPIAARDAVGLIDELTAELATAGYTAEQTFGYPIEKLEASGVLLVGAWVDDELVGLGGLEVQPDGFAELKRFFVQPSHRGAGVADAVLDALVDAARAQEVRTLRLETGDKQRAAIAFYRRHGFVDCERFGPYRTSETSVCMLREL